ncbi:calnexin-like isoform X2 [Arctopsyche grandis]|uniref:calnexin-like isoform X2 n=1 Tax=Arctopsyche grandis TaxID=121162 RepID=UPI00406D78F6
MNSNVLFWLAAFGFLCIAVSNSHYALAQQDDDDFDDDGIVADEVEAPASEAMDYTSPIVTPNKFYFAEHFDDIDKFKQKWIVSQAKKDGADEQIAKYDGEWQVEQPQRPILKNDLGLVLKSKVKHAAISARFSRPFVFTDKPFIVQYEVTMQEGQECGGAYIKLLSSGKESTDLKQFTDKTPYTIMFGPDKCGNDHKLHFIFRHKNPKNGTLEEKHCKKPKDRLEEPFKDKRPHLYTLYLQPDNTYTVLLDHKEINSGSLLEDFTPSVNPPEEIDDPSDAKPNDWDDRERISDPTASKPDDWDESAPPQISDPKAVKPDGWLDDEPEMISDPTGEKPADWDMDMDGEWEAPLVENPKCTNAPGCGKWSAALITNPNYKGVWRAPMIPNPQYQGKWAPKKIPNPFFFKDENPFKMTTIAAVGIELWSMSPMLLFDNIIVTDDPDAAFAWAKQTFDLKVDKLDSDSESLWRWIVKATEQKPWLWGVYVLIFALLFGVSIFLCCSSSEEKDANKEEEAISKKTDAEVEDQPLIEEEESNPENDEEASQGEEEFSESNAKPEADEAVEPIADNQQSDSAGEPDAIDAPSDMPRKRKTRKE